MILKRLSYGLFLLLAVSFLATSATGFQPYVVWNRTFGAPYDDGAWSLQKTDDNGYIIAGYTSSRGEGSDLWLLKTDSSGLEQWNRTFGGSQEDVAYFVKQTRDLGYIVTGSTRSYGIGEERLWLLKTDSNGSKDWDHTFGGFVSSSGDGGWAIDQTDDGGYIVTGYTKSYGAGGKDLWLVKTDSVGIKQWDKTFGGPKDDVGMSVAQTRDGGYIVAGRTASFGSGGDDIWLLKVDTKGREQWNRTFGGQKDDVALQVIKLKDGYALTGRTDSVDSGGKKAFLLKTDLHGNRLWE
jgi:predicted secreted protein